MVVVRGGLFGNEPEVFFAIDFEGEVFGAVFSCERGGDEFVVCDVLESLSCTKC